MFDFEIFVFDVFFASQQKETSNNFGNVENAAMLRRRKIWIALAIFCVVVRGLFFVRHWGEPVYKGKPLTTWFNAYCREQERSYWKPDAQLEANFQNAMREAGTNAVPHLLEQLRYEEPRSRWREIIKSIKKHLLPNSAENREHTWFVHRTAIAGLQALGSNASPALVELGTMLNQPASAEEIGFIFPLLGPSSFNVLTNALTNQNVVVRKTVVTYAYSYEDRDGLATVARASLKDGDPEIRRMALRLLSRSSIPKPEAVEQLIRFMNDTDVRIQLVAIEQLPEYGTNALAAIPALQEKIKETNAITMTQASSIISQIKANAAAALP